MRQIFKVVNFVFGLIQIGVLLFYSSPKYMPKGTNCLNCALEWQNYKYISAKIFKIIKSSKQNKNKIFSSKYLFIFLENNLNAF